MQLNKLTNVDIKNKNKRRNLNRKKKGKTNKQNYVTFASYHNFILKLKFNKIKQIDKRSYLPMPFF